MSSNPKSSQLKQRRKHYQENIALIILVVVALAGVFATTLLSRRGQDIRRRAAVEGGEVTINLPESGRYDPGQTHRLPLSVTLTDKSIDGLQIKATIFNGNAASVTFEPAAIDGLTLAKNNLNSVENNLEFELGLVTTDPNVPFNQSGEVILGHFVFTNPSENTLITIDFDNILTKVLDSDTGMELADMTQSPTYRFAATDADPCFIDAAKVILMTPAGCNSLAQAFTLIGSDASGHQIKVAPGTYTLEGLQTNASNVTIYRSEGSSTQEIVFNTTGPIQFTNSANIAVSDITLNGSGLSTLSVVSTDNVILEDLIIKNTNNSGSAVYALNSSNVTVNQSVISSTSRGITAASTETLGIINSVIKDSQKGIFLGTGTSATISNNLIWNNSQNGIHTASAGDFTINQNTLINNGGDGETLSFSAVHVQSVAPEQTLTMHNNLFAFNTNSIVTEGFSNLPANFSYLNNGFWQNANTPQGAGAPTMDIDNNVLVNPQFSSSPEADGYCIPQDSPAVFGSIQNFGFMGRDNFCGEETPDPEDPTDPEEPTDPQDPSASYYLEIAPNAAVNLTLDGANDSVRLSALLYDEDDQLVTDYTGLTYEWTTSGAVTGAARTDCPFGVAEPCPANSFDVQGTSIGSGTVVVKVTNANNQVLDTETFNITIQEAMQPQSLKIITRIAAINGDVGPIQARVQIGAMGDPTPLLSTTQALTFNSGGTYTTNLDVSDVTLSPNQAYWISVKGSKHVQRVVAVSSIYDNPVVDMSASVMRPGDLPLPAQDGVVDANDLNAILSRMSKAVQTIEDLNVADVNFDGAVNSIDFGHVLQTLSNQSEDTN